MQGFVGWLAPRQLAWRSECAQRCFRACDWFDLFVIKCFCLLGWGGGGWRGVTIARDPLDIRLTTPLHGQGLRVLVSESGSVALVLTCAATAPLWRLLPCLARQLSHEVLPKTVRHATLNGGCSPPPM